MNFGKIGEFFLGKGKGGASDSDSQKLREAGEEVEKYLKQIEATYARASRFDERLALLAKPMLALSPEMRVFIVEAAVERATVLDRKMKEFRKKCRDPYNPHQEKGWDELVYPRNQLNYLVELILKKRLPITKKELTRIAMWGLDEDYLHPQYFPITGFVGAVENYSSDNLLEEDLKTLLHRFVEKLEIYQREESVRRSTRKLKEVLSSGRKLVVEPGEAWSDFAILSLEAESEGDKDSWYELLECCAEATGSSPTAKWSKRVRKIVAEKIGTEAFRAKVLSWFPLIDEPRVEALPSESWANPSLYAIVGNNADILKGLAWASEFAPSAGMYRGLTDLALFSFKKVPGVGCRIPKVGNACITVLGKAGDLDAVGQLAVLKVKVKFIPAQKMIAKALTESADRQGLPRDEIEEMSVPAYGLECGGTAVFEIGNASVELRVVDSRRVQAQWRNSQGKLLKAPPASLKRDYAEDFKELRQSLKDIEKMLSAQAGRIESMLLGSKSWGYEVWRDRYFNHPLVGGIARRLIWKFEVADSWVAGFWDGSAISTAEGELIDERHVTQVALWHPLDSSAAEVLQWRERVETLRIKQPFKQAHREVYVLTPAEERTDIYSNRFAAHIIKQAPFNALCSQRGWKNKLRVIYDGGGHEPTQLDMPERGMRVEFLCEGISIDDGETCNEMGAYLYVSTDQVRFLRFRSAEERRIDPWGTDEPIPLREIPPKIFSEVMRDVDLFIGVCSVGNDPAWIDGGSGGRARNYWQEYSFGVLSQSAEGRKDLLERLVPKLKIAEKCSFVDRFLVVKGSLHTYKIHLGSGNILMSPDDRYLCIVATHSGKTDGDTYLPFEGDRTLSVILSKAFLLAADNKITDKTILAQIK